MAKHVKCFPLIATFKMTCLEKMPVCPHLLCPSQLSRTYLCMYIVYLYLSMFNMIVCWCMTENEGAAGFNVF